MIKKLLTSSSAAIKIETMTKDSAQIYSAIENLAIMVKGGFEDVFEKMATKKDVASIEARMGILEQTVNILRRDTEAGFLEIREGIKMLKIDIEELKTTEPDIISLRRRMARVEKKVGIVER